MKALNHLTVFFFALCLALPAWASSGVTTDTDRAESPTTVFDRLNREGILRITLELNREQLMADRNTDNFQRARLSDGREDYAVKIEVRGRYRRRICDFPPLKLKFDKKWLRAGGLSTHNDLKLVTHCLNSAEGKENVLREQLSYEIYGLLSGHSLRTQLVEVTYLDSETGSTETQFGILIEDIDELAERLGGEECDDCFVQDKNAYVPNAPEIVTLFQYMIGNSDWSLRMARNIKMIQFPDGSYTAVPYDFDFSGLVDASYAVPNDNVGQRFIGERIWQWDFQEAASCETVKSIFLAKRSAIMEKIDSFDLLSNRSRKKISRYISDFYDTLESGEFQS